MRVGAGNTLQHTKFVVGLIVAISVFEEPDFRWRRDQNASAPELESGDAVKFIGKDNEIVGNAVTIFIRKYCQRVSARLRRIPMRIRRPNRYPQTAITCLPPSRYHRIGSESDEETSLPTRRDSPAFLPQPASFGWLHCHRDSHLDFSGVCSGC